MTDTYSILTKGMSPAQIDAINSTDSDVEIIACAGAGKTSVVTRRIINILRTKPDIEPGNIVAFTFTRKAADELKSRIYSIGKSVLGNTEGFANMFIGTIHGFCLHMLQDYVPQFRTFSVLDEIHTKLFVERYCTDVGMTSLGLEKYLDTDLFIRVMSVLNESWSDESKWSPDVRNAFHNYQDALYSKHYFDYSLILREMVVQLQKNPQFRKTISERVKYLTVDEYQDTNPAQEKLISLLKKFGANVCVVGDDDQTIYQFRGSDSENIITFQSRYEIEKSILLETNYRSTEGIVDVARTVIAQNNHRLAKEMKSGCKTIYDEGDIVFEERETLEEEYEFIAGNIEKLHDAGIPYSEIAILLRKRKLGKGVADILNKRNIPFVIEGMNELLYTKEGKASQAIFRYLNGEISLNDVHSLWKEVDYPFDEKVLADSFTPLMVMDVSKMHYYPDLNLQSIYQDVLSKMELIEDGRRETEIILYNLGKFSQVIGDYETINYTVSPKYKLSGFCAFLKYTAGDYYPEGYLGNSYTKPDAVPIMTIHQSKGLEFAALFVPGLNTNFFPAQKVGGKNIWHVIQKDWITSSERFETTIEDERKLFYVAVTRAKKFLFLSRAKKTRDKKVSVFLEEAKASGYLRPYMPLYSISEEHLPLLRREDMPINLNFSLLEDYFVCPYRFKLSVFYGFVEPISERMGYGNALHDVVRAINLAVIDGKPITKEFVDESFSNLFYLPYATEKQEAAMRTSAKRGIDRYVDGLKSNGSILLAEAPIEIDMGDGITVNGRMDMVRRQEVQGNAETIIVDFKTANRRLQESLDSEQLRIYALGYQFLTGTMADRMEIHHLDSGERADREIDRQILEGIEVDIRNAAAAIRRNEFPKVSCKEKCSKCIRARLCLQKKDQKEYFKKTFYD